MTIFSRSDKSPDTNSRSGTPQTAGDKPDVPTAVVVEPKKMPEAPPQAAPLPQQSNSTSVISRALKITGQLESTENIQIDGEIDGDVRGVGVKVGPNAKVKGTVYGESVEIAGTVEGKIEAKKVLLTSSAKMTGDVIHQDITIQSGAYISGHCRPEFGKTERTEKPQTLVAVPKDGAQRAS